MITTIAQVTISIQAFSSTCSNFHKEKTAQFTRSISSTIIGKPVLMMDLEVSKYKQIRR